MTKVTSEELAALAGKCLNIEGIDICELPIRAAEELAADIRSLAASVLSQAPPSLDRPAQMYLTPEQMAAKRGKE